MWRLGTASLVALGLSACQALLDFRDAKDDAEPDAASTPGADGGSALSDAGAATEPDTSAPGCGTTSTLDICDDFEGSEFPSSWWTPIGNDAGAVALDETESFSPRHSLRCFVPSGAAGPLAFAGLRHTRSFAPKFNLSVWLRVEPQPVNVTLEPVSVRLAGPESSWQVALLVANMTARLELRLPQSSTLTSWTPLPAGDWTHLELEVDYSLAHVALSVDGTVKVVEPRFARPAKAPSDEIGVELGLLARSPGSTFAGKVDYRLDDVKFWTRR